MNFDNDLVVGKLRRWEKFLAAYRLPEWDAIPDFGLYMEQVVQLLKQYLDYLPPELKQTEPITAAAINNYVRTKLLPEPRKKRYYRIHIAYLIMICTLKQSLRLSMLPALLPGDLPEEDVKTAYAAFDQAAVLTGFTVSPGAVSQAGDYAVLCADITLRAQGEDAARTGYPLRLEREGGLWKISYARLLALMGQE